MDILTFDRSLIVLIQETNHRYRSKCIRQKGKGPRPISSQYPNKVVIRGSDDGAYNNKATFLFETYIVEID